MKKTKETKTYLDGKLVHTRRTVTVTTTTSEGIEDNPHLDKVFQELAKYFDSIKNENANDKEEAP